MAGTRRMECNHLVFERLLFLALGHEIFVDIFGDQFRKREIVDFFFANDIVFALRRVAVEQFTVLQKPDRGCGNITRV